MKQEKMNKYVNFLPIFTNHSVSLQLTDFLLTGNSSLQNRCWRCISDAVISNVDSYRRGAFRLWTSEVHPSIHPYPIPSIPMDLNGFKWIQMDSNVFKWVQMGSNGFHSATCILHLADIERTDIFLKGYCCKIFDFDLNFEILLLLS